MNNNYTIFIPKNLNYLLINFKQYFLIYIYTKNYFAVYLYPNKNSLKFNKNLKIIILKSIKTINNKNYFFLLNSIIQKFSKIQYLKIMFNGKGFRLKKQKKLNNFFFNNSNLKLYKEINTKIIKITKNSFLYLFNTQKHYNNISFFVNLFKLNIFTKKGIRLNRTIFLIKKFKKK